MIETFRSSRAAVSDRERGLFANPPADGGSATAPLERTEVRGAGDGSMKLDRVVVTGSKDIPHRAPDFSSEQAAAMLCAAHKGGLQRRATRGACTRRR